MVTRLSRFRRCARALLLANALVALAPGLRAQAASENEPVVMLPPMMVEGRTAWRYFAMPGREVLASCDESLAVQVVERLRQLDELMPAILPARFTAGAAVPETLILVGENFGRTQGREVVDDAIRLGGSRARFMPNLQLPDRDETAAFAMVSKASRFAYMGEHIASLLERRVPRLPDWFIEGVSRFYRQTEFGERDISVFPASWTSAQELAALRVEPDRPRILLPMEEFFAHQRNRRDASDDRETTWQAQAALFVRWALLENDGAMKEALWNFVDRLEREPASEPLLRECFGLGYADLRDTLSDYLPAATRQPAKITPPSASGSRPAKAKFRPATELEIARIRGDWERLEIGYVRGIAPTLVEKYAAQARKTQHAAYDAGERDPRLLATMGLTELDAGNPAAALPFLEAAVTGKVVRPLAYYELALLRYQAAVAGIGRTGKLSADLAADVMTPLLDGLRQEPPLLESYVLMSEVATRSDAPPTAAQLAALHEGALKFPHVSEFVARVIALHIAGGQPNAANALAEAGRRYARPTASRASADQPPANSPLSVEERFKQARALARDGDPAEALRALQWCWDEGSKRLSAVTASGQMSSLVSSLGELAKRYPPAVEFLRERQSSLRQQLLATEGDGREFAPDYVRASQALNDAQGVVGLSKEIQRGDPRRSLLLMYATDLLVAAKRYDLLMEGSDAERMVAVAGSTLLNLRSQPSRDSPGSARVPPTLWQAIEVLAGVGDVKHAREIAEKVLAFDSSAETRALIQQRAERAGHPELLAK